MSFVKRIIEITITLGTGDFGDTGGNTLTLSGHRTQVNISNFGGDSQGEAHVRIYGLTLDVINQLTTIGPLMTEIRGKNLINISAGDDSGALSQIYQGSIQIAFGEFQSAPDVGLNIVAYSAMRAALATATPSSYGSSSSVANVMADLAAKGQLNFINHNVDSVLPPSYFSGSVWDQIKSCAAAAGIDQIVENGTLSIWPRGGSREGEIPVIEPGAGLVGYPVFSSQGMVLECEFLPTVRTGGKITVNKSSIPMANGTWKVFTSEHNISSEWPGGPWFTTMQVWNRE